MLNMNKKMLSQYPMLGQAIKIFYYLTWRSPSINTLIIEEYQIVPSAHMSSFL